MFDLTTTNELTMSSLEIADLVGSRHDNVKRAIEALANKGVISFPQSEEKPTNGRPRTSFIFSGEQGKRDSIIVVAQLSPEFTARLVDRWKELESGIKPINLNDPEFLRGVLLNYTEKTIHLEKKVEAQSQKIESLESLFTEGMTVPAFCKQLNGVHVNKVNAFLKSKQWLSGDSQKGYRMAYLARDKYLTEQVAHEFQRSNGNKGISYRQVLLKDGATRLFDMYMKGELPMKKDWDGSYDHSKFLFSREVA